TLESVGDRAYIYSLVDYTPNPHNVKHYARIVRDMAFKRSLIEVGYEVTSLGYSTANGVEEAFDKSESAIFGVGKRMRRERLTPIRIPLKESFHRMEKARKEGSSITGVETGFTHLDKLTSGLQPSNLIIIGGRTAMGKTSLALNIAHYASVRKRIGVLIFSLEMSKIELSERLLCTQAKVSSTDYRTGKISDERLVEVVGATGVLSSAPIFIDDTGDITLTQMRSKSRQLMSKEDIGLIIIDYMQLMHIPGFREGRTQEVSRIARELKFLAMELEIPVIAVSQLRRPSQSVVKKEPNLEDLRESGAIEQNADLVLLIYRREVDDPRSLDHKGKAEINLAKHRSGETGKFELGWRGEHTQFTNLSAEEEAFPS
ncbi:MAG: replicative DNA helicase, partial [Actinobacteria bacterium]|nr:replicative DNA helicase [Actinomycetota bacterium]MCG2794906.1 replicative DNA helicase [Actinomycetes bacterium]